MTSPIRKIVIIGRDAAAWVSALALERSFGRNGAGIGVELVELPSKLRPEDAFVTLPAQQALHRLLGLDEIPLLRACAGLYVLAQRFSNWSGAAPPYLHAYDTHGISLSHVRFFQYWLKARASGLNVPLEEFSLGAVAAKQGRFVVFNESTEAFSNATYGYHLSAISYLHAVGKSALAAGLKHTVGEVDIVEHRDRRIESVRLTDGSVVKGDLFVDASGPEGCLIHHLEKDNFESWREWLPCDRMMAASGPVLNPVPAFSQISAFREGWLGLYPLMNRTAMISGYDSQYISDGDVLSKMSALSGLRLEGDAVTTAISAGRRREPWIGNCVAIGDTAVMPDPLDAVDLHPLHTGISYLVSLLPVDRNDMPEAGIYNAKMASHAAGIRDFQISHYKLNRRFDEPFWDAVRDVEVPETLAEKLRLFQARGMVRIEEDETFQEENWTSIFTGHNLVPKSWDPLVDRTPEQEQIALFQRMLKFIASEVEAMPSLQAHLELNAPSPASDYIF
ncbi:MAG TPA: tryptophan halogenase family protein [Woeseiaceae bacterium]|nr:tryptophan halogenase family protein [Woeseiaceae bacterium]